MRRPVPHPHHSQPSSVVMNPVFVRPGEASEFSTFQLPAGESLPETARQIVHDEAMLDGNARLNLATFVGTWMEDEANRLYLEAADKNMIDKDEYPQTAAIEERCLHILGDLWNAPDPHAAIGTSAVGSSEACMLGGLARKRRWQQRRRAAGIHQNTFEKIQYRLPERRIAQGSVSTQAISRLRTVAICSPDLLAAIVPATPEDSTCVVDTGSPYMSAAPIVTAATSSADAPCA
jgi:hypothetical protein